MAFTVIETYEYIIFSMILLDLLQDNLKKIKSLIILKCLECEREREDLQLFIDVMEQRPLQFTLWRIIPISMIVFLSFVSFCVIHIMAVIQIRLFIDTP
ncbi:uncharacterized protein LOC142982980 [Anticarsia gemmatalis]|uniref:uncharacterized protein LOC142982980 n=1 Tax=Anticarsia gemmatalis TaxID=129554 RepID=UPI003F766EEF